MSFSYNPFKEVSIVKVDGVYFYECSSCGGRLPKRPLLPNTPIKDVFLIASEHVKSSHKRTEEDFQ